MHPFVFRWLLYTRAVLWNTTDALTHVIMPQCVYFENFISILFAPLVVCDLVDLRKSLYEEPEPRFFCMYNWFTHFEDLFESSPRSVFTHAFYQQAISRVDSRPKLERYLKRFCRRLICCEFFLSLKPVPTPCPDQCQADGGYISTLYLVS